MKEDKKEYCLIGLSDVTPENIIKILENNTVDKDYLIKNAIDYLKSLGCTPEKYKEEYDKLTS